MKIQKDSPKIVVIGGGTGSFTLLRALKKVTPNITALVNMADSGGSTGVLRDELGVLPPGDVRQCLVALSEASDEMRELFNFRFAEGTFAGHSFGNLFLSAVEKMGDNFADAVRMASDLLRITGKVVPMTLSNCQLALHDGEVKTVGEYEITLMAFSEPPKLTLEPRAKINPEAEVAILAADLVVIAPGNLYGSLVPALLVDGVPEALRATKARVAFVCNLVNKHKQTPDFDVCRYASEIERFAGDKILDYVLYNTDAPTEDQLKKYALDDEFPVRVDERAFASATYEAIGGKFLSHLESQHNSHDTRIERSLIRHDAEAVAEVLRRIAR